VGRLLRPVGVAQPIPHPLEGGPEGVGQQTDVGGAVVARSTEVVGLEPFQDLEQDGATGGGRQVVSRSLR